MITFEKAIDVAKENLRILVPNSKDVSLEGVLISDNKKLYEVDLSYDLSRKDPLEGSSSNLKSLSQIMSYHRKYKKFLVDYDTGDFRGFRNEN